MAITLDGTNGITTPDLTVDSPTLTIDSANNLVGIGTVTPTQKLTVEGDIRSFHADATNTFIRVENSTGSINLFKSNDTCELRINDTDPFIISHTNGSPERFRIDSSGNVGLGITNPSTSLDLSLKTDAIALPQGTTAQRPTGNNPYIRYNTTNSALEFYNGTDWVEIISDYFPSGSVILG
jgi:hypothetical protein